jgi:hypothetical protein
MYNKNKFKNILTIFVIVFFASLIGLTIWQNFYWPKADLYLKGEPLTVLVANNQAHRFKGLGDRDNLGNYDGMLFIYSFKDRLGVVMRDMRFPISVVWFNDGEVVDIAPILQLEPGVSEENLRVYRPRVEANSFLELPTGWVEAHGLKIGDKLEVVE